MTKKLRTITRDETPHDTTLFLSVFIAAQLAKLGFKLGDYFVKNQFGLNKQTSPTSTSFGGSVGYLIVFGWIVRLLNVDLMRTDFMRRIDARFGNFEVFLKRKFGVTHDAVMSEEMMRQRSWSAELKFFLRRAATYGSVAAVGASAALLLPDVMYAGVDVFEKENEIYCRYGVAGLMLLQLGRMLAACRADQPVRLLRSDDATAIPVVVDATPHPIMIALFAAAAVMFSLWGLQQGEQYAENKFILGEPLSVMAGGYPFMVIFFGMLLQAAAVDAMRFKPMIYVNDRVGDLTTRATDYVSGVAARFFPTGFNALPDSDAPTSANAEDYHNVEGQPNTVIWNEHTRWEFAKLVMCCLESYVSLAAAGASVALLPLDMQYEGIDASTDQSKRVCMVGLSILALIQVGMVLSGCRADQYSGKLDYDEPEEKSVMRFCPGC